MAGKTRTREVTIVGNSTGFRPFFKKFSGEKKDYDFEGVSSLRKLLSNERSRMLHVIKNKNPGSIYELAKILKRDLKSVNNDIKLMERFGFIDMISEKTGKRERLRPMVVVDSIHINLKI
jgi:predicted transcriptional regulator